MTETSPAPMVTLDEAGRIIPAQQTRISAFLMSAHGAHARRLTLSLAGPVENGGQMILHTEYCRATELVSLLARSTHWVMDPMLPLLTMGWEAAWLPAQLEPAGPALEDMTIELSAFGHALYGGIRPATAIPPEADPQSPFMLAIRELELESSRLIQGQIAFLKSPALQSRREAIEAALDFRQRQMRALWQQLLEDMPG
ncbi:MAG: hypothetical protein AB7E29_12665 [Xanthobacter sp.]